MGKVFVTPEEKARRAEAMQQHERMIMAQQNLSREVSNCIEILRRREKDESVKAQQIVEFVVADFTAQIERHGYLRARYGMNDLGNIPRSEYNDLRLAAKLLKKMGFSASFCTDSQKLKVGIPRFLLREPQY